MGQPSEVVTSHAGRAGNLGTTLLVPLAGAGSWPTAEDDYFVLKSTGDRETSLDES